MSSDIRKMRSSFTFGVSFISVFVLSFFMGYYLGVYSLHYDKMKALVLGIIVMVCTLFMETFLFIIKTSKGELENKSNADDVHPKFREFGKHGGNTEKKQNTNIFGKNEKVEKID